MWEKIKKGLDDAYQGIKTGTSKVTLKAEEKTKLTRLNMKVNSLKKEVDSIMARLGNRLFTLREDKYQGDLFEDQTLKAILGEADQAKHKVHELQEEMDNTRLEYETKIQELEVVEAEDPPVEEKSEKEAQVGKE